MAKLRSRKDVTALYERAKQLANPNITGFASAVAMRTRLGGIRSGYINRLNRLQKKVKGQLKGLPGCGPRLKDWLVDEEM